MKKTDGFILITTLIFLLILSLFAYQALSHALLEIKLFETLKRERLLFSEAQKGLVTGENSLKNSCPDKNHCITVTLTGKDEYKIISKASRGDMSVVLESRCQKPVPQTPCVRISWAQLPVG